MLIMKSINIELDLLGYTMFARTRYNNNLHLQIANLSKFNKLAYISGVKVFKHLPQYIKTLANDQKCFKSTLKGF
jgi:hypothetical protein